MMSTPTNRLNGNTLSLTEVYDGTISEVTPCSVKVTPAMILAAIFGNGTFVAFETNGDVRLARGFTSRM